MSEPREYLVDAGELRLSVRDHEGGEPPVVALHGLASNARWWDLVAPRLAPRHRVIAIDQRGHGLSDKPEDGYDFAQCTADVMAAVHSLGLEKFIVAGHSWGASVALSLAAAHPDKVIGCICVDGGVTDLRSVFGDSWETAEVTMRPPDLGGITRDELRRWIDMSPLADASDAATSLGILLGNFEDNGEGGLRPRLRVERHMKIARHLYELDGHGLLAEVDCPVLLIMAALGSGRGVSSERMLSSKQSGVDDALSHLGSHGAVIWVEGEHDLPVQRPAEVATAMQAFIDALPAHA